MRQVLRLDGPVLLQLLLLLIGSSCLRRWCGQQVVLVQDALGIAQSRGVISLAEADIGQLQQRSVLHEQRFGLGQIPSGGALGRRRRSRAGCLLRGSSLASRCSIGFCGLGRLGRALKHRIDQSQDVFEAHCRCHQGILTIQHISLRGWGLCRLRYRRCSTGRPCALLNILATSKLSHDVGLVDQQGKSSRGAASLSSTGELRHPGPKGSRPS
mmetsp:Transcript_21856/g.51209  ORF Transcript_21856/g.51209 Transcript_21856/m.51209 type:complete len:213 (+) Transcript_21856:913-1551(+)